MSDAAGQQTWGAGQSCTNHLCTNIGSSISVMSREDIIYGEKGQQVFHAVTWQSILSHAELAAAQSNHQCQWEHLLHIKEQEKNMVPKEESKNPCSNQESEANILCTWWSTNFVFHVVIYPAGAMCQHVNDRGNSFYFFSALPARWGLGNSKEVWKWQSMGRNPACMSNPFTPGEIWGIVTLV